MKDLLRFLEFGLLLFNTGCLIIPIRSDIEGSPWERFMPVKAVKFECNVLHVSYCVENVLEMNWSAIIVAVSDKYMCVRS